MKLLRQIVYPLSFLYGQIIRFRNKCYDKGIFTSTVFGLPNIVVGNLNTGGTGKTPHVEYLINLLKEKYKVAVLSRGYKRKSNGFVVANKNATAPLIGDEPMQYHLKFKNLIVAVDTDRVHGLNKLSNLKNKPDVVILDDAYQHRSVSSKINILLTSFNDLYVNDTMLPTGNLRESPKNARRATHIIVTKCPLELSENEQLNIKETLKLHNNQKLFFTGISYKDILKNKTQQLPFSELKNKKVILVTGIANPKPLVAYLKNKNIDFEHLKYKDHYNFKPKDIEFIKDKLALYKTNDALVLTTEKDYVRTFMNMKNIFYLPIEVVFLHAAKEFNTDIITYVEQSTRNS